MLQLAKKIDQTALFLAYLAIISFFILGTLSFLPAYRNVLWLGKASYYVPTGLIFLSMPLSFFSGWLLYHMRIAPAKTYLSILIVASLLFLTGPYFGWVAWLGIPWVIKWHIQGFEQHIVEQKKLHSKSDN